MGSEKRLRLIAADIVEHFEQRLEVLQGKAMVVCMSRRICVELYEELVRLRPDWAAESTAEPSGSSAEIRARRLPVRGAGSGPSGGRNARTQKRRRRLG